MWPAIARYSSNETLSWRVNRDETDLVALALHPEVLHAVTVLNVANTQAAKLLAAHTVMEQGGQDSAVAQALERVRRRRFEQFAGLSVAERRRRAFVTVGGRALHPDNRSNSNLATAVTYERSRGLTLPYRASAGASKGRGCARVIKDIITHYPTGRELLP